MLKVVCVCYLFIYSLSPDYMHGLELFNFIFLKSLSFQVTQQGMNLCYTQLDMLNSKSSCTFGNLYTRVGLAHL